MNRLKYVLGINVPRRIPSNAVVLSKRRSKELCKRHQSEVHLSKSTHLLSFQTKRSAEHFRSSYHTKSTYETHQRNKKVSFPTECIQKRRSSTCQQRRVSSGKRYSGRNNEKVTDPVKHSKCHMITEAGISVEKEPRSYAQMIASYNEMMYTQNSSGIMKDNLSSAMINGIHRSPFSSASVVSLKWKSKSKSSKNTASWNGYNQNAKFSSDTTTTCRGTAWSDKNLMDTIGENNHILDNASYATMIEKYSNKLHFGTDSYGLHTNMIHKRNVSTKFDVVPVTLMDAKSTGNKSDFSSSNKTGKAANKSVEVKRTVVNRDDYDGWVTKVDGIIKDLKRITAKNDSIDSKSDDKWMLQSVNEHAHWLDRVITAHKKKINNQKPTIEKGATTIVPSEATQFQQSPEPDNADTLNNLIRPKEELRKQSTKMSSSKPTNPIIEYIKKGPVSSTTRNTSQSPPSVASSSTKEPQIELRMTPSQNESVVSINVDELATKTAGTKDQLSVIISSKKDAAGNVSAANTVARSDFASMHISISENTIPVKQIEFSINGKPVSELKSIVARADKLDVLGSLDKVEIRIPSKESGAVTSQPVKTVGNSAASPVLNLQIAAKFNEPRYQQPRNADLKETPQMPPPAPPPTPTPPLPHVPPKPRTPNLFTPDTTKIGETKIDVPKSEETRIAKDGNILKVTNDKRSDNVNTPKVDTFVPKTNEAVFQRSDMSIPPSNHPRQPPMNNPNPSDNKTTENRTPSNIIPWWSSEESFKKIKKKGNTPKHALTTFNDPLNEPQVKQNVNVIPEKELTLNPDVPLNKQPNPVDIKKADTRSDDVKDAVVKKQIVDEKNKSLNVSDTLARSVQLKSSQKWKTNSVTKHLKPKSVSNSSRIVKRIKYRVKSNLNAEKSSATVKKDPDTKTSSIPSPKEVAYIAVDPETGNLGLKEEPQVFPSSPKVVENDQQKMAQKTNDAKLSEEKSKVERKIKESAVVQGADPQIGKENKQQLKDTVLKEEKSLGERVNKSADVSAKGTPSTGTHTKHSQSTNKEEKQRKIDASNKENLPNKPISEDQRIKEILKSMKPIEKRKDGTLIDYGVKVSSRKPSEKINQNTSVTTNPLGEPNEKIVEPKKVFPRKKQVLTERKYVPNKLKIMQSEKVSIVKKPIAVSNSETKLDTKNVNRSKMIVEPKKKHVLTKVKNLLDKAKILEPDSVSQIKKSTEVPNNQINPETKNVSKPDTKVFTGKAGTDKKPLSTIKMDNAKDRKSVTSTSSDTKINVSNSSIKQNSRSVSANIEQTPLSRTASKQTGNIKMKPLHKNSGNILNRETTASSELQTTGKTESKEALKPAEKKKESFQSTIVFPSKDPPKSAEKKMESLKGTIASSSSKDALKPLEMKKELERTILTPTKDTSKSAEKKMESLKGTIASPFKDALKPSEMKKESERTILTSWTDFSKQAEKKMASREGTIASSSKDALKPLEMKKQLERTILTPTKDTSKTAEKKMESLKGTIASPSKDALESSEMKKELERTIFTPTKDTSKSAEKKMESLKGTIASSSKDALKPPVKKKELERTILTPSKDTLEPTEKKMESLKGTIVSSSKDALKLPEKMKSLKGVTASPSKDALKPAEKKMELLRGTIVSSSKDALKLPEKKESLDGTTISPSKISDKTESKTDTFRFSRDVKSEESIAALKKKGGSTGVAPFQGTIDKQLSKTRNALAGLTGIGKEKKVTSKISPRNENDSLKMNVAKKSSNKGGSDTGSGGSMSSPTGPAGLRDASNSSSKQTFDKNDPEKGSKHDENSALIKESDAYVLLPYNEDRPEKDILYTSWLQRFKDRLEDDKIH